MDETQELNGEAAPLKGGLLDRITFVIILVGLFLLPLAFLPSVAFPFQFTKSIVFSLTVLAAFIVFVIARLKEGVLRIPDWRFFGAGSLVIVATFLATVFSGNFGVSWNGQGFEVGTFVSILLSFVLMFLTAEVFRKRERIFYGFVAFCLSAALVFIFQAIRLLLPDWFTFGGLFSSPISNLVGRWNDVSIFFGSTALLSLCVTEFLTVNRLFRIALYGVLVLSLLFITVVNFSLTWGTLLALSLLVFFLSKRQHSTAIDTEVKKRSFPIAPLVVVLISAIFLVDGFFLNQVIGNWIADTMKVAQIEARPSWGITADIAKSSLAKNPVFGVGPNQFTKEWLLQKPAAINSTAFWNTEFGTAVGLLPTYLITTGVVGFLTWLLFLGVFVWAGLKLVRTSPTDPLERFLSITSFLVSLYMVVFMVAYVPSIVIVTLSFFFLGLFIASLGNRHEKIITFAHSPRTGFVMVPLLILVLLGGAFLSVSLIQKFLSFKYFQQAVYTYNSTGSLATTETLLQKATKLSDTDLYDRFLSQLNILKINDLLSKNQDSMTTDEFKTKFQGYFTEALNYAKLASARNSGDYQNWVALGQVYEAVVPLKVSGAYENALNYYTEALKRNPNNPALYLAVARLELANGNTKNARTYVAKAREAKPDYAEAIFLDAQIEVSAGNLDAAITSVKKIAQLTPNDPNIFFQLGLLDYNKKNYIEAIAALERAVSLVPNYSNAKYFLGLSYYEMKRTADAIKQFTDVVALNPDNAEAKLILANLQAGKAPFTNAKPPVTPKPEKRATAPIPDTGTPTGGQ